MISFYRVCYALHVRMGVQISPSKKTPSPLKCKVSGLIEVLWQTHFSTQTHQHTINCMRCIPSKSTEKFRAVSNIAEENIVAKSGEEE